MSREEILENILVLSRSQGFYGRMYKLLSDGSERAERALSELERQHFGDVVDLILFLES